MFEEDLPKKVIGSLAPLPVIDNIVYEFYRLAPPRVMLSLVSVGLAKFAPDDVERVFEPIDRLVDMLTERGVDLIMQSGVPLPVLIGIDAHDRLLQRIEKRSGVPATSSVLGVVAAAKMLGLKKVALANKWSDAMNDSLGKFFAREGIAVSGASAKELSPAEFQKMPREDSCDLAYFLGRAAFEAHPEADGLYVGGGAWISQPVGERLEQEFGRPVITNTNAMVWDTLKRVDAWRPLTGHGKLLAAA